jgi:hypothetical protein
MVLTSWDVVRRQEEPKSSEKYTGNSTANIGRGSSEVEQQLENEPARDVAMMISRTPRAEHDGVAVHYGIAPFHRIPAAGRLFHHAYLYARCAWALLQHPSSALPSLSALLQPSSSARLRFRPCCSPSHPTLSLPPSPHQRTPQLSPHLSPAPSPLSPCPCAHPLFCFWFRSRSFPIEIT